jgi:23S rRNA pseudouridine1911/1915/1917 synthase
VVSGPRRFAFVVGEDEAGERLDRVCAAHVAGEAISRSALEPLFGTDAAHVNGRVAKASLRVRAGDHVEIVVPPPEPLSAQPENIPLDVLFEDEHLMVLNKPAGLVVHPARGHARGTLVNALLHHATLELEIDDEGGGDPLRPGIVHRLDKDTSGVLVVAKTAAAREGLKKQFQTHTIERSYVAITVGVPPDEATYDTLHGRHPSDRLRFTTRVREGKRAVTHVKLLEVLAKGHAALVRCTLHTGRTHQIRVHLSEHGFPLLGDAVYGKTPRDAKVRSAGERLGRQALHAEVLGFEHPITRGPMRFTTPPPEDFAAALKALKF